MSSTPLRLRLRGVDCEGCASRVRRSLEELEGVEAVREVSVEDRSVELDLDRNVTSREDLAEALDDAGFPVRRMEEGEPPEADEDRSLPYGLLGLLVLSAGLVGYAGYELYPRFDLPAVEGASLLLLAVGAGVACFFSPCAFSLLLTLLGREVRTGARSEEDDGDPPGPGGPFRFASALSLGATVFLLALGAVIALGGRALVGDVVFTSTEGRVLRLGVGLFLVLMGLVQVGLFPNPLHAVEDWLRPLLRKQAETRRGHPFVGYTLFGFGYLFAGFG